MSTVVYISLSKQVGLFKQLDVIANNIANTDTPGFRKEYMLTNELKKEKISYANEIATVLDTSAGGIVQTNIALDMAIIGDAYFRIDTPLGARYTRNGKFRTDADGNLVDSNFNLVATSGGGNINIPADSVVNVDPSGSVYADGELVGQVGAFRFANQNLLQPVGGGLYKAFAPEIPAQEYKIISGAYEESNVKGVVEMQNLLSTQRDNELNNNIMKIAEDLETYALKSLVDIAKQ